MNDKKQGHPAAYPDKMPRDTQKKAFWAAVEAYCTFVCPISGNHTGSVNNAALDWALYVYEKNRVPEPVQPQFVLTRTEEHARDIAARSLSMRTQGSISVGCAVLADVLSALDRACKTLAFPSDTDRAVRDAIDALDLRDESAAPTSDEWILVEGCKGVAMALKDCHQRIAELEAQLAAKHPAQAGGEWTAEDYDTAAAAIAYRNRQSAERPYISRANEKDARVALDAVKHRLAAAAIEPPTKLEQAAFDVLELEPYIAPNVARDCVAAWRKRFPKLAPKPLHRIAFEASLASTHDVESEEYWQDITQAVIAAERATKPC